MAGEVNTDVPMGSSDAAQPNGHSQEATNGSVRADQNATSQSLEGLETRFQQRCEVDLALDDKTTEQALRLFKECEPLLRDHIDTIGAGSVDETERLWNACVLFVLKRFSDGTVKEDDDKIGKNSIVGFTLSQILKTTQLSLLEFFKEMPQFLAKTGRVWKTVYGDDWEKRLMVKEVQTDFYYLTVLFNYYKRVCQNLFMSADRCDTSSGTSLGTNGRAETPVHIQFGWMLFLAFRMHALSQFVDLVTYINGLLAVVIIMILHIPPGLRKFSLKDSSFFKERGADGRVKIVASICALYHDASEEDVSKMVQKVGGMIGELFKKNSSLRTRSHTEQLAGIDTEGVAYFEGLMDERSIVSNLRIVEKEYEEAYLSRGELDERMFISGDENVIGTLSSGTPTSSGSKRKYDAISAPNQGATVSTGACLPSTLSPYSSPVKLSAVTNSRMPPATPVSVTMSTVKWLRTYICPLPAQPSPDLQCFFESCDRDISAEVAHRVQVLLKEIFSTDRKSKSRDSRGPAFLALDSTWVEQRQLEATKLYYRVLTAMCKAESQRLANKNLTALLTNERFHRCMVACSAELVLYTHKTVTMTFPAVLEPTGITAFDLSKVIESFVRHEETLPRELKRHLNSMEQQILETMAWEKGSSMYNALIVAKKHLSPVIDRLGLLAEPMPALDNLSQLSRLVPRTVEIKTEHTGSGVPASSQILATTSANTGIPPTTKDSGDQAGILLSPKKELPSSSIFASPTKSQQQPPLQSAFASPQRPSPLGGGETCAETVISVFLQKVLKLAAVRIKDLCERLHLSNQVLEQVYGIMTHVLYKETSLFFNRHIDQMILCSIYGICKVNKANVTFKKCIEHYGKQPQCKRHVFCNVFIDSPPVRGEGKASQEMGDIVRFYNEVFVPATKQYLLHLGQTAAAAPAPSSGVQPRGDDKTDKDGHKPGSPKRPFPALPDLSPKKVSASHNVYVSPLRTTKMDTIMSPHTRSLYACVGESTHAYQSPSKDLTAINNRLNNRRSRGRLDFSKASLVSDSLVTGSLYPCARSAMHHSTHLTSDSILINGQSQPSWTSAPPLPPSPLKCPRTDS